MNRPPKKRYEVPTSSYRGQESGQRRPEQGRVSSRNSSYPEGSRARTASGISMDTRPRIPRGVTEETRHRSRTGSSQTAAERTRRESAQNSAAYIRRESAQESPVRTRRETSQAGAARTRSERTQGNAERTRREPSQGITVRTRNERTQGSAERTRREPSQGITARTRGESAQRNTARTRTGSSQGSRNTSARRQGNGRKAYPAGQSYSRDQVYLRSKAYAGGRTHPTDRAAARNKAYAGKRKKRTAQLLKRIVVIAAAVFLFVFLILEIFPVRTSATVEAGSESSIKDFMRFGFMDGSFTEKSEAYDTNVPGTYQLEIKAGIFKHRCKLTVEDTTAPVVETKELEVGLNETCEAKDFIVSAKDVTEVSARFETEPDYTIQGKEQNLTIIVSDTSGNETRKDVVMKVVPVFSRITVEVGSKAPTLEKFLPKKAEIGEEDHIITDMSGFDFKTLGEHQVEIYYKGITYPSTIEVNDTKAPVFEFAENFEAFIGEGIRYKAQVTVRDNSGSYDLDIDTSDVNPDKAGTYKVKYTATDPSGNSSSKTIKITLSKKTANEKELFEKVDKILDDIIKDGMTTREKARAIFEYTNWSYSFVNDSEKGDYVKAALEMIKRGHGDCYSFFSLAKALLTRAGIKNMDIDYVNRPVNEHYWNLVDIEDGHGWYHFDTTPTVSGDEIYLWTEDQIQSINKDGRYSYDHSKYPNIK